MLSRFRHWKVQVLIAILSALLLPGAFPARATSCLGSNLAYSDNTNDGTSFGVCGSWGRCQQPVGAVISYSFNTPGCDPHSGSCGMTATVSAQFPGNHQNDPSASGFAYSWIRSRRSRGQAPERPRAPGPTSGAATS